MLEEKLNQDFKDALKSKDEIKVSVIRMLKADITNTVLKLKKEKLTDDELLKIVQNHIKRHEDSIEQFKKGNRIDLVKKEEQELKVLKTYVPEQLSDEALEHIVKMSISECGASLLKDAGKVIKSVIEKTKGKADGKRISAAVSKLLSG